MRMRKTRKLEEVGKPLEENTNTETLPKYLASTNYKDKQRRNQITKNTFLFLEKRRKARKNEKSKRILEEKNENPTEKLEKPWAEKIGTL